jgi:hypothetical protein
VIDSGAGVRHDDDGGHDMSDAKGAKEKPPLLDREGNPIPPSSGKPADEKPPSGDKPSGRR